MYSYTWFACRASGGGCVETLEEAKERFVNDKVIFGAYRYEVHLRNTGELILKG